MVKLRQNDSRNDSFGAFGGPSYLVVYELSFPNILSVSMMPEFVFRMSRQATLGHDDNVLRKFLASGPTDIADGMTEASSKEEQDRGLGFKDVQSQNLDRRVKHAGV